MVEAFLAFKSMASIVALVGGHTISGFSWLLFPVSTALSAVALVVCRSLAFAWGWPILSARGFYDFARWKPLGPMVGVNCRILNPVARIRTFLIT